MIVLKRRIMNEILTTYLPSVLILIIVYVTNYFKPFFFEAVVTVNLTSLLVLTTLFISVSDTLPPTAYVKLIDIWLIFSQVIPFFEVLLHTFIDSKRKDGQDREINHHGKMIKVGTESTNNDSNVLFVREKNFFELDGKIPERIPFDPELIARNEKEELEARQKFYNKVDIDIYWILFGEITGEAGPRLELPGGQKDYCPP
ncbi:glutamate-gated chloride channel subunit beta [Eurytemora carolleeae]|uniref:glutamate-gated chloride channel subunit beta n=1 Tax=Eurytemora carolleeae TaxID=1294199 RepID=UPI000C77C2B2|nr:glutamate-gated chloride channel subunit beta [Eurytemora carolleeae]|eukprot:XP_023332771.1 glutamate-gated chloride channel subunit beta-like [Eurytemora affinis]